WIRARSLAFAAFSAAFALASLAFSFALAAFSAALALAAFAFSFRALAFSAALALAAFAFSFRALAFSAALALAAFDFSASWALAALGSFTDFSFFLVESVFAGARASIRGDSTSAGDRERRERAGSVFTDLAPRVAADLPVAESLARWAASFTREGADG